MRCCASPTTSTAAEPPRPVALAEALLFRAILRPLAAALGPAGDVALGAAVDRIILGPPR